VKESERDLDLLTYIDESVALIVEYTGEGPQRFRQESMIQDAVLRRLETLADATRELSNELTRRHPEVPWREIYGFRNVAAHNYRNLDTGQIWTIVQDYLPALRSVVLEELSRFSS
jgi:uncharacterized protein with HEPN domain